MHSRLLICVAAFSVACGSSQPSSATSTAAPSSNTGEEETVAEQPSALPCAGLSIVISSEPTASEEGERITLRCGPTDVTYDDGSGERQVELEAWDRAWGTLESLDWNRPSACAESFVMSISRGRDGEAQRICVTGDSPDFQEVFYTAREVIAPFDTPP